MLAATAAPRYNRAMRRPPRPALIIVVLLLVAIGGYGAFWFVAASRLESGIADWAQSLPAQNLELKWRRVRVDGFPFKFAVELEDARLRDLNPTPVGELQAPLLSGSARPWNFFVWQLSAPKGLTATIGPDNGTTKIAARTAQGSVAVTGDGGAMIWLGLGEPEADAGLRIAARQVELWVNLPPNPVQSHSQPSLGVALAAREIGLPTVPAPFRNPLDELSLGATVMGPLPAQPPRRAAQIWRDAGGTLELDHLAVRWGTLAITGSGTLALDTDLQPIGGFSGAVAGYEELMAALVAAGRMRASDARLARLALAMLAKPGPDGRPQIATSFTIQNGEMYLGPAKLGPAPRIDWR